MWDSGCRQRGYTKYTKLAENRSLRNPANEGKQVGQKAKWFDDKRTPDETIKERK